MREALTTAALWCQCTQQAVRTVCKSYKLVPAMTYLRVKGKPVDGWKAIIRSANVGRDGFKVAFTPIYAKRLKKEENGKRHIFGQVARIRGRQDIKCRTSLDTSGTTVLQS